MSAPPAAAAASSSSASASVPCSAAPCFTVQYMKWLDKHPTPLRSDFIGLDGEKPDEVYFESNIMVDYEKRRLDYLISLGGNIDVVENNKAVAIEQVHVEQAKKRLLALCGQASSRKRPRRNEGCGDGDNHDDHSNEQKEEREGSINRAASSGAAATAATAAASSSPPLSSRSVDDALLRLQSEHYALLVRYADQMHEMEHIIAKCNKLEQELASTRNISRSVADDFDRHVQMYQSIQFTIKNMRRSTEELSDRLHTSGEA